MFWCRRVILIDQRMAFFFYFTAPDVLDGDQSIYSLSADAPTSTATNSSPSIMSDSVTGQGKQPVHGASNTMSSAASKRSHYMGASSGGIPEK
jgi:hypothetical protein